MYETGIQPLLEVRASTLGSLDRSDVLKRLSVVMFNMGFPSKLGPLRLV